MFILNPQSGVPIYRQILEQVRRMVASGQLRPALKCLRFAIWPMRTP